MALLLLLPILVCGFLYLRIHQKHKHNISKLEGHHLYFKSAYHGFFFTLLGFVFFIFCNNFNNFKTFTNTTKELISHNIYNFDFVNNLPNKTSNTPSSPSRIGDNIDSKIKLTEEYKGLATLNFYFMLIWTTIFSVLIIYFYAYSSFFIRVLYEWLKQWIKILWNNFILRLFAILITLFKTIIYTIYLFFILILDKILGEKDIFKITPITFNTNNNLENENSIHKLKIKIQTHSSFISIWKSWSYGLVSISKEITDPLDQLLYQSIQSHQTTNLTDENQLFDNKIKPIMLSMDDKKIYIGIIIGFGFNKDAFSIKNETFRFLPLISGYRDKDTLKVIKTTDYIQTVKNLNALKSIELILRKENIISATMFNFEHFKKFQDVQFSSEENIDLK